MAGKQLNMAGKQLNMAGKQLAGKQLAFPKWKRLNMAGKYAELYDHEWSFIGTIIYKWLLAHLQSLIGGG